MTSDSLLCGLTPYHIRVLTDNPWDGGGGEKLEDVGSWSLDQCFFKLIDRKKLAKKSRASPDTVNKTMANKDGLIKGRSSDGSPMKARIRGKSFARKLMEEAAKNKKEEKETAPKLTKAQRRQRMRQISMTKKKGR